MKQLRIPNLDPVIYQGGQALDSWLGYCLAYAQFAFNAPWAGSSAWDAWTNYVHKRHYDYELPRGVWVPIWFDGWWAGQRYGHVALFKDGIIYCSPVSNKPTADVWYSIHDVERNYGMKYVGWSEDIGGVDVIGKGEETPMITREQENVLSVLATGGYPGEAYDYRWTGTNRYDECLAFWMNYANTEGWIAGDKLRKEALDSARRDLEGMRERVGSLEQQAAAAMQEKANVENAYKRELAAAEDAKKAAEDQAEVERKEKQSLISTLKEIFGNLFTK